MTDIIWLERFAIELLHAESLSDHGGLSGLRDESMLESALARPRNLHGYDGVEDILALAACYAVAIAKNHPFLDGNKRAGFVAAFVFAQQNGFRLTADQAEAAAAMLAVASGEMTLEEFAAWLHQQRVADD